MKRKTFSLSVEAGIAGGKDKPPALPNPVGNHEEILTEIMDRLDRMESLAVFRRRPKLLEELEGRIEKLEEAAAGAAANPAYDQIPMSPADQALVQGFVDRMREPMKLPSQGDPA